MHLELVGSLEGVARAKGELVAALPPGGTAVVPRRRARPSQRDDLEVVRASASARRSRARRAAARASLDGGEVELQLHRAAPGARTRSPRCRRSTRSACRSSPARACDVELSRWRGEESPLPGGGLLINDAYNANPVSMRAALDAPRRARRRRGGASRSSARWPSSGRTRPRSTARSARGSRTHGVEALVAVGELARGYVDGAPACRSRAGRRTPTAAAAASRELVEPGDCVLVKASRAVGLEVVAEALDGGAR